MYKKGHLLECLTLWAEGGEGGYIAVAQQCEECTDVIPL